MFFPHCASSTFYNQWKAGSSQLQYKGAQQTMSSSTETSEATIFYQVFSQMGIQASCGQPLIKKNCFIFHMLSLVTNSSFEQTL